MKIMNVCVALVTLLMSSLVSGAVRINEICADNKDSLKTAAGDAPDWVELYNDSEQIVSLEDWSMTDSKNNPRRFVFPSGVSIAPHAYLVLFADGSDTPIQGAGVHINFSLSKSGEYLALLDLLGNTVSALTFPEQLQDVTYGYAPRENAPIGDGAPCTFWVPDGSLPQNVVKYSGKGALGFASAQSQGAFTVKYYELNADVPNLATAEARLANPATWKNGFPVAGQYPTVNFITSGSGTFGGHVPFPTQTSGSDKNYFIVTAEGGIYIPTAGMWTFAVASDDGFKLNITGHGMNFYSEFTGTRGLQPTFGKFNFPVAGVYNVSLVMFQNDGGAGLEFAVAQGSTENYNASTFSLVGGASCPVKHAGAFGALIDTNIKTQMDGGSQKRAQMRSEWSFVIDELPEANDAFTLYLRYTDGYQAWLAGTLLGQANIPAPAPPPPGFNDRSAATAARPIEDYMTWEVISIPTSLLTVGTNTLSVYGLRHSTTNDNFFLQVRLVQNTIALHLSYFAEPTPGAENAKAYNPPTPPVTISEPHGYKTQAFTTQLSCADPSATIRYTLNGSYPTAANSIVYTNPIPVSATTVLRAAVIDPDSVQQRVSTASWLFLEQVLTQSSPAGWPTYNINGQVYKYVMNQSIRTTYPVHLRNGFTNAIPTLSIAIDQDNFSGAQKGIYSNPGNDGIGWERPISLELIDPVRGPQKEFQCNAGLRIRGAASRGTGNPKHAFRVFFRNEYGAGKLKFPMFDADGAEEFDKFDLRCSGNGSWAQGDSNDTFIRDVFSRDCQRDMAMPHTRSRPYHIFINGVYWGLYETQERGEANYAESYFGGKTSDWDALKTAHPGYVLHATDGTMDSLNALWNCSVNQGFAPSGSTSGNYMRMRGLNPNGTPNPAYPAYLDETNLICRVMVMHYAGDPDSPISIWGGHQNNIVAVFNRNNPDGFKWLCHDAEWSLGLNSGYPANCNVTQAGSSFSAFSHFNPNTLHLKLCANPEYKMHFADQVQKHMFGDGALTTANSQARWRKRMDALGDAVVAESARWGDGSRTVNTWTNACSYVLNTFLAQRRETVLSQYRSNGWFPQIDAPTLSLDTPVAPNQAGGGGPMLAPKTTSVEQGTVINISAANAFYYTLDGTDPRLPGGGVSPSAIAVGNPVPSVPPQTLVAHGAAWRYYDAGATPPAAGGLSWKDPAYDATAWPQGPSTLGFAGGDPTNPVATQTKRYVNGSSGTQVNTTYFRHTFTVSDLSGISSLAAEMLCDDGAVVYLNGIEIVRYNMNAGTPDYSTFAAGNIGDTAQTSYYTYPVNVSPLPLQAGVNVLAAEVHQSNASSTDLYFDFTLTASASSAPGGGAYTASLTAQGDLTVMARCHNGTEWSALAETAISLQEPPMDYTKLRVSKLMFAPLKGTTGEVAAGGNNDDDSYAWLELTNTGSTDLSLKDVLMTNNVTCVFGNVTLPPGGRYLVCKHKKSFDIRYPEDTPPNDTGRDRKNWDKGNIARKGGLDKIFEFYDPDGNLIYQFTYSSEWFGGKAYNTGRWIEAKDLGLQDPSLWSTEGAWQLNPLPESPYSKLRVSKLMFAPPAPNTGEAQTSGNIDHYAWLELTNTSTSELNLKDVLMTNNIRCVFGNVTLQPGDRYLVCKNKDAFDARYPEGTPPNDTGRPRKNWDGGNIARNGGPDKAFEFYAPDGTLIYSFNYTSQWFSTFAYNTGRWIEAKDLGLQDDPQDPQGPGLWSTEDAWRLNPVPSDGGDYTTLRISKFMYGAYDPTGDETALGFDSVDDFAWLELYNTGPAPVDLANVSLYGVTHLFAPRLLQPQARLVVAKKAGAFAHRYPASGIDLIEWTSGNLSQNGEQLTLCAPDGVTNISFTYDNNWYNVTNTGRYLVAVDLTQPQTNAYWSTAPAWRPSATSNAVPGRPEKPLLTAPRLDTQSGRSFRFGISNLDGLWLDVLYSIDLLQWHTLAPALWTRDQDAITIDIADPALPVPVQDKAFFRLRQQ